MKKYFALALSLLSVIFTSAQGVTETQDFFASNLKIYVVVAVLAIILSCIFIFLLAIDRRLKELENKGAARN